jgi:hypothetical protein
MESWRRVLREGFLPQASGPALLLLRLRLQQQARDPLTELGNHDCLLLRGTTTCPPALPSLGDWPCEAACPVGTLALGDGAVTVEEVQNAFGQMCFNADQCLGEPAACRWMLNWIDEAPWPEVRDGLLAELDREISRRQTRGIVSALVTD